MPADSGAKGVAEVTAKAAAAAVDGQPRIEGGARPVVHGMNVDGPPVLHHPHHNGMPPQTPEQIAAQAKFQAEHAGHESQHAAMAWILISSLVLSQLSFVIWKRYHARSFHAATLLGLWLVPPILGVQAGNYRFSCVWLLYSIINCWIVRKAFEMPMRSSTPRWVYKWYTVVYNISYSIGITGYITVLLSFFHVPLILHIAKLETEAKMFEAGIIVLFYGLYFGTLGRDSVVVLSDRMAVSVGYYSKSGFPAKHLRSGVCGICGDATDLVPADTLHKLNCGHTYHNPCIRGWTIIGKKDVCPFCKEKVDLKSLHRNPWDTSQQLYLNLLDAMRYLLAYIPVVFYIVHLVFEVSGLK
ncbi:hypothetical protein HKX48_004035 [Thoreauomyces humboldtii]|nr:hypothetical protein HKX48_004035 [Thoreauomyces humboldtii]